MSKVEKKNHEKVYCRKDDGKVHSEGGVAAGTIFGLLQDIVEWAWGIRGRGGDHK